MTELNIADIFSEDVDMFSCRNFAKGWTIVNFICFCFILFTFTLSRKRLVLPYIIFRHIQILYTLCLVNQMKDECLSMFLESYDSFFFFRVVRYFIGPEETSFKHSFLHVYNAYDDMLSNLFDMYFYMIVFSVIFVIVILAYLQILVTTKNKGYLKRAKYFVDLFSYSVPIKLFELFFYPLTLIYLSGLYNISKLSVFDGFVLFIVLLLVQFYMWSSLFVLNTYFNFYFKSIFIRKFGALYIHTYFFDLKKLAVMAETDTMDSYSKYRIFNLVRNHLILEKVFYYVMAVFIVYFQDSSGIVSYAMIMVSIVIGQAVFLLLQRKNGQFFYYGGYDNVYTVSNIVLVLTVMILMINSRVHNSIKFGAVFIMIINITLTMLMFMAYAHEFISLQTTDLVWKLKIRKQDKINDREDYVQMLRAEQLQQDLTVSRSLKKSGTTNRPYIQNNTIQEFSLKEEANPFKETEEENLLTTNLRDEQPEEKVANLKNNLYKFIFEKYKIDK